MTTHQVRHCPFEVSSCGTVQTILMGRSRAIFPWRWMVCAHFVRAGKGDPCKSRTNFGAFPKFCDWPKIPGCVVALALVWFYWFFLTSSWCVVDLLLISCWRCWCCWGCLLCCYWVIGLLGWLVRWFVGCWSKAPASGNSRAQNGALLGRRWLHQATCGCVLKKDAKLTGA